MGDVNKAPEAATDEVEDEAKTPGPEGGGEPESQAGSGEESSETSVDDELPEWARERISKANREAASYRTQLRELQDKTKEYKTVEEFNSAMEELNTKLAARDRELIAETHRIPEDMREFIIGENAEDWEASAKKLSERLATADPTPPPTSTPPSGARKKAPAEITADPAAAALKTLHRR